MCGSGSRLANPSMVPYADISPHPSHSKASPLKESTETTSSTNSCTPSSQEHVSSYLFTVQQQLAGLGFTKRSCYEAQVLRIMLHVNRRRKLRTLSLIHPVVNPNIHDRYEVTYCDKLGSFRTAQFKRFRFS